jgi:integrase
LRALCHSYAIDPDTEFSASDFCFLVTMYAEGDRSGPRKHTSVQQFISAAREYARSKWGVDYQLCGGRLLFETLASLRKMYTGSDVPDPKHPIELADLVAFHSLLDRSYFEHARTFCAATLAFFAVLRINEYCGGALQWGDLHLTGYGLSVVIRRSKTNRRPDTIPVCKRNDVLCPVRALLHYRSFFSLLGIPYGEADPVFVARLHNGSRLVALDEAHFIENIRSLIATIFPRRNPMDYAGHSFRRGGATAMLAHGAPADAVQQQGRWRPDCYKRYIASNTPVVRLLATQALLPRP